MNLKSSSPTLTGVTFSENTAGSSGGGMYLQDSSPTLTDVTFSGNTAGSSGGGIYLVASSPTLTDVTFSGNTAEGDGGGMYLYSSNPTLTNMIFSNNTAGSSGGGMYLKSSSNPTLTNMIFSNNTAENGGGMRLWESSPTLINVTFSNNTAENGGGMRLIDSSPTLINVTFSNNTAENGGGMRLIDSSPTLISSIIWDNSPESISIHSGTATITYSNIEGDTTWTGVGNINLDPLFCDAENGDLTLAENSPCINTEADGAYMGSLDIGCEPTMGCKDETACNYNADGTDSDGSCEYCSCQTCSEHGTCVDTGSNYTCTCNSFYTGTNCETDIDECATANGGCGEAACVNNEGTAPTCTELSLFNGLIPLDFNIHSIYPNPFNPTTIISFSIPVFGLTTITAYDITGRELETLTNTVLSGGNYSIDWNASSYPSGVYLIRMDSGDFTQTQKVVLVK